MRHKVNNAFSQLCGLNTYNSLIATIFKLEDSKTSIVVRDNKSVLKEVFVFKTLSVFSIFDAMNTFQIQYKLEEMAAELLREKAENAKLRTNLANSIMMQECLAKQMEIMNAREDVSKNQAGQLDHISSDDLTHIYFQHHAVVAEESQITSSQHELPNDQNVYDSTE